MEVSKECERDTEKLIEGPIFEALKKLKEDPDKYAGVVWDTGVEKYAHADQKYNLINRGPGMHPQQMMMRKCTYVYAKYTPLGPATFTDTWWTDHPSFACNKMPLDFIRPGRGEGLADTPDLKLFGDVDPDDLFQVCACVSE